MKPLAIYTTPPDAGVTLAHDDGPTFVAVDGIGANGRPGHIFSIDGVGDGHGAKLTVEKPGFATVTQRGTLWLSRPGQFAEFEVDDILLNPRQVAPPLQIRGQFFEQVGGTRITLIETSDFNLLNIFQHQGPEAAHVIADQRQALGFNLARVWTRYTAGTGAGQYLDIDYSYVGPFLDFMGAHGLYVDLTAYTGRDAFRADHWDRLGEAVAGHTNVLGSLVNENDQPNNTIDLTPYRPWLGVLCSKGSNGSEHWPPNPNNEGWAWLEFHDNGASEWWRKGSHNGMEIAEAYGMPVITNEQTRYVDNEQSIAHAYDDGQASVLLIAGSCFHSRQGKTSSLFAGLTLDAAKAHVDGMQSLPLECQDGPYVHRQDLEGPDDLRVYQRGNNPVCIARIRK